MRHPLLQGGGLLFNRVAGPGAKPGDDNGVLIARVGTDSSLASFEIGMQNFVNNIENAYWDLYFSYHDLDAKTAAHDATLETWHGVNSRVQTGYREDA